MTKLTVEGSRLLRRLLALFAIVGVGLSAPGCSDERPDGVGGGRRDGGREDDGGGFVPRDAAPSRPPPDTIVPCRLLSDPRGLTVGEGSGAQLPSVVPGRFADEIALAYPRGPSGPSRVTVERVSSDGDVLDDPTFATPEHPQVSSPALVETPRGAMLAYVHDEFPPPRAYLVTRLRDDLPWSDPVPLSDGFREIRLLRAMPIGDQGALVAFREVDRDGEEPARLRLGRGDPDADVLADPERETPPPLAQTPLATCARRLPSMSITPHPRFRNPGSMPKTLMFDCPLKFSQP